MHILGLNGISNAAGNAAIVALGDIPWLQDEARTDVWTSWDVTYRDVVLRDREGRQVGVFNLTEHDLGNPDHYAELRQMLLDAAAE